MLVDASALIALLLGEAGGECVAEALAAGGLAISAVSRAEVVSRLCRDMPAEESLSIMRLLDLPVIAFGAEDAEPAGVLNQRYEGVLSLGDAACIASAQRRGLPVLTADRGWAALGLEVELRLIRA